MKISRQILPIWLLLGMLYKISLAMPGIFFLPFISSPKLLQKVSSTLQPSSTYAPTTPNPIRSGDPSSDFIKLHKWQEIPQQSTPVYVHNGGNNAQPRFHLLVEGSQPKPQHFHGLGTATPIIIVSPPKLSPNGQVAGMASNHGPPQRSPSMHQQNQLIPLTFPPTTPIPADSYILPRIIALPQVHHHSQQQQLHSHSQSSSHYSTTSQGYSFSKGHDEESGPPKTTKVVRHVSVFVAPPDIPYNNNRNKIRLNGDAEKHVNIIFIKGPDPSQSNAAEIELPPSPEQKTYVYVLNKAQDDIGNVIVNTPQPPKYNPPDVFFLKYKDGEQKHGEKKNENQPQQQYGPPPQQQYGPPPQQQYGPPPQQQYGPPPQQQYGPPPQQHQPSASPKMDTHQQPGQIKDNALNQIQQQKLPSVELVAPSNQKYNITLPSSQLVVPLSSYTSIRNSNSQLAPVLASSKKVSESSKSIQVADRRMSEESYYDSQNLNYSSYTRSHHRHDWHNTLENNIKVKVEQDEIHPNKSESTGLYSQLSKGIINMELINDNDNDNLNSARRSEVASKPRSNITYIYATPVLSVPGDSSPVTKQETKKVSFSPVISTRSFFPSTVPPLFAVGDNKGSSQGKTHPFYLGKNGSISEPFKEKNVFNRPDEKVTSNLDIIVLTRQNLTSPVDDGNDNVKKKEKTGSPRSISGRPGDFRPYKYAPSMDHNSFGVSGR